VAVAGGRIAPPGEVRARSASTAAAILSPVTSVPVTTTSADAGACEKARAKDRDPAWLGPRAEPGRQRGQHGQRPRDGDDDDYRSDRHADEQVVTRQAQPGHRDHHGDARDPCPGCAASEAATWLTAWRTAGSAVNVSPRPWAWISTSSG
jgi:hypothetical protein